MADETATGAGRAGEIKRGLRLRVRALVAGAIAERERWFLWSPVLLGTGIGIYFALPWEPTFWTGAIPALLCVVVALASRREPAALLGAIACLMIATGFAAAQIRSHSVAAPVLERNYGPAPVIGTVIRVESYSNGSRVTLADVALRGLEVNEVPHHVRIKLRRGDPAAVGDRIDVFAKLSPPSPPAAPGAYDFQRSAWFRELGATGFALGESRRLEEAPRSFSLHLTVLRQHIGQRIRNALPGESGAVAVALITGDRSGISQHTLENMRDSGLAHLLAISGLHLGLVTLTLFFGLRTLLAFSESLALKKPIKKWAAGAAIIGSFGYLLLAGGTVPTQRAFLMTGLVLLAVLLDREAISMRLVAWAALGVLLLAPESLLGASFQMSFAAVVALVAFYEAARGRLQLLRSWMPGGVPGRVLFYATGVAATTVIASVATGMVGLNHFGRIAAYGLPANMIAVPLTALWIMPWAVIAVLLMPLGLEDVAFMAMGWGIDAVLWVAAGVSDWPGAVRPVPAMPLWGLVVLALGGLWLCLWRRRWRFAGIAGIVAGLLSIPMAPSPDILISNDGGLMAVKMDDGRLAVSEIKREKYIARIWFERHGQVAGKYWPETGATMDDSLSCDALACSYRPDGREISLIRDGLAIDEDCRRADIVVSQVPIRTRCPGPELIVDWFDLWRYGATAIWLKDGRVFTLTVAETQGNRPWSIYARRAANRSR